MKLRKAKKIAQRYFLDMAGAHNHEDAHERSLHWKKSTWAEAMNNKRVCNAVWTRRFKFRHTKAAHGRRLAFLSKMLESVVGRERKKILFS